MKIKVYDVYRFCNGISEHRFTGTNDECWDYVFHRGDTSRATYSIENGHEVEI